MHEDVADRRARHKQSAGADQAQAPHPFGIAHRQLGGDPATDAVADQIEALQAQGVEDLEVMEDDILDAVAFGELVALRAAGMGGAITRAGGAEPQVKGLETSGHAVHVGKAVEVNQRLALPALPTRRGRRLSSARRSKTAPRKASTATARTMRPWMPAPHICSRSRAHASLHEIAQHDGQRPARLGHRHVRRRRHHRDQRAVRGRQRERRRSTDRRSRGR